MMNKTKKKNVYVKYAVIMCISGALGGILGGGHGNGTSAWSSDRYSGGNAILPEQCPQLDASADGNLWSDSAGTL